MSITLLTLDPGTEQSGIALFKNGKLDDVEVLRVKDTQGNKEQRASYMARKVILWAEDRKALKKARIVIEYPRVYPKGAGKQSESDPDDILSLVLVVGHLWAEAHGINDNIVSLVRPADWKGQVPKAVMVRRIISTLDATEQALAENKVRNNHNAMDAVGIGLHALKRPWGSGT